MLVEKLKQIAQTNDWKFNYGPDGWQNLGDYQLDDNKPFEERNKYLLLLWKDKTNRLNIHAGIDGYTFDGEFVFLVRSKMSDPSYAYKHETHIKNLEPLTELICNSFDPCDRWTVKAWKEIEVTDAYDANMDGLKIKFTIQYGN